jgi:hypothetical protein
LAAHFPQLATLEKLGLTHIKTLEDLDLFIRQMTTLLNQSNPHSTIHCRKKYDKYYHKVRSSVYPWLFEYTCQDCGLVNATRSFHFHHLDPTKKQFNILGGDGGAGRKDKLKIFKEIFKCVYVCENCHYQRHADMGDLDEDFKAINRRRHTYIQNLLGCPE